MVSYWSFKIHCKSELLNSSSPFTNLQNSAIQHPLALSSLVRSSPLSVRIGNISTYLNCIQHANLTLSCSFLFHLNLSFAQLYIVLFFKACIPHHMKYFDMFACSKLYLPWHVLSLILQNAYSAQLHTLNRVTHLIRLCL